LTLLGVLRGRAEIGRIQSMAGFEIGLAAQAREAVPRAHQLAVVATEDAVADQRPQRFRDRTAKLDREIGNTAPGIEPIRPEDRLGRGLFCGANDCVVTGESTPIEPGGFQRKYYARGVGWILEVSPETGAVVHLVGYKTEHTRVSLRLVGSIQPQDRPAGCDGLGIEQREIVRPRTSRPAGVASRLEIRETFGAHPASNPARSAAGTHGRHCSE